MPADTPPPVPLPPSPQLPLDAESALPFAAPPAADALIERTLVLDRPGHLVVSYHSPRPLRVWIGRHLVVEEAPQRDRYHIRRHLRGAFALPLPAGTHALRIEAEARPAHLPLVDADAADPRRAALLAALAVRIPDELRLAPVFRPDAPGPALSFRFEPGQYRHDGATWQDVWLRRIPGFGALVAPFLGWDVPEPTWVPALAASAAPALGTRPSAPWPGRASAADHRGHVPVAAPGAEVPRARPDDAPDPRLEPEREIVARHTLHVRHPDGDFDLPLPVYEAVGRLAPKRDHTVVSAPLLADVLAAAPRPLLPDAPGWRGLDRLHASAWRIVCALWRDLPPESGLPNGYVRTAAHGFGDQIFVWDTCFTALGTAYAWRAFPATASLDCLHAGQEDGGHLERERDVRDGVALLFEPGFGPNPPLLAFAETHLARLTGDRDRLALVYPALVANYRWLVRHRTLPDGCAWTTGLASGLDNSPAQGEAHPDLTAQLAHFAEQLAWIADRLHLAAEAIAWRAEHARLAAALNARLWSDALGCYAPSLPGGGHNPHKTITTFWPLWAGCVPPDRAAALARLAADPATFNRPHPLPSLAADSPLYRPDGGYWRGSVWAPTAAAALRGLWRSGALALARELCLRHLGQLLAVHDATGGRLWENYAPERPAPGAPSGPDYSWTTANPIALLYEILLGLDPDATTATLRWRPPGLDGAGVENYALGPATLRLVQHRATTGWTFDIDTDRPFTLVIVRDDGGETVHALAAGRTRLHV